MTDAVAPDGSPVALYLRLDGAEDAERVHALIPARASVLELGSGAGRVTRPLMALGHAVSAVDDSADMLTHVAGAEALHADIVGLDLHRTFPVVLLMSHFVNEADPALRRAFVATCARHLAPGGVVVVQRYAPGWVASATAARHERDGVIFDLHDVVHDGGTLRATAGYVVDGVRFDQPFAAVDVDDPALSALAASVGLVVAGRADDSGAWVTLTWPDAHDHTAPPQTRLHQYAIVCMIMQSAAPRPERASDSP